MPKKSIRKTKSMKKQKIKLKKDKCCCGSTKRIPCVCMIIGGTCSSSKPKCPCFKLLEKQMKSRS